MTTDINEVLNRELAILDKFDAIEKPSYKRVTQLAKRLFAEAENDTERFLCKDILSAKDPVKYMRECINKIRDCAELIKQFVDEGCHGMIMTGKDGLDVYPIRLNTRANWLDADDQWDPEQEAQIRLDCADDWMRQHNKGYFYGKVILFPYFGFSGEPRLIELRCGDTTGMEKVPGTKYYKHADAAVKGDALLDSKAKTSNLLDLMKQGVKRNG